MARKRKTHIVLEPHREDCAYFNGMNDATRGWPTPWCLPNTESLPYRNDGSKAPGRQASYWLVFRCGDSTCHARLAVNEAYALSRIHLWGKQSRKFGRPENVEVADV